MMFKISVEYNEVDGDYIIRHIPSGGHVVTVKSTSDACKFLDAILVKLVKGAGMYETEVNL